MAKPNVTDESPTAKGDDSSAGFVKGYQASTPEAANSPKRDSYEPYRAPGENAVALKKKWQGRPSLLPSGEGDDGAF
jgi:hypothetical protein